MYRLTMNIAELSSETCQFRMQEFVKISLKIKEKYIFIETLREFISSSFGQLEMWQEVLWTEKECGQRETDLDKGIKKVTVWKSVGKEG